MNRTRLLIISMTLIACAAIAVAQTPRRRTGVAGPKPTPTPTPASVSSPPQQPADPPPATLAIVNDTSITQSDVADQINAAISNDPDLYLRAFYLDPEKEIKEARQRALDARINSLLLAAEARKRERRDRAVAKAQAALDEAERDHDARAAAIDVERAAVEKRAQDEEARWEKQKEKLAAALRRARSE